jgi:hypothetical protein
VLGVVDRLVEEHGDVVVEQGLYHGAAGSPPGDQAKMRSIRSW